MALSLFLHVYHGYKPKNLVLTPREGYLQLVPMTEPGQALPGLILYHFSHSMYYANAELLAQEMLDLIKVGPPPVTWLCIDMSAVDDVDFSAAAVLREVYKELNEHSVRLVFAKANAEVRKELDLSGITKLVGQDGFYKTLEDVLEAYSQKAEASE